MIDPTTQDTPRAKTPGRARRRAALGCSSLVAMAAIALAPAARAQSVGSPVTTDPDTKPATAAAAPAPTPFKSPSFDDIWKGTKFTGQIEGGFSYDPSRGPDSYNFGQLFTDHGNTVQMNQLLLTAERDTDPNATDWDFGFKLQGLYGSDGRYTHYLGEFTHVTDDRYQPEILEANVSVHAPVSALGGGLDLKVGQFATPEGYEVINASGNPFYSHSYIFFYGLPFVATGALAVAHVNSTLDVYGEVDTGLNTTFGDGDYNREPAGLAGFGLNGLMGGKVTFLALSHFGPEDSTKVIGPAANRYWRFLNDATLTYKPSAKLTLVTDVNYSREDYFHAEAWGVAQYLSTPITDQVTFNLRGEIFRDSENFFVAGFPGNLDFVNAQLGNANTAIFAAKPGTYSELTAGLTISPKLPIPVSSFMIRPEIRYDRSLNNSRPYAGNKDDGALTVATDLIVGF